MFNKLFSRLQGKKSDHPLGSDDNLNTLIGDIHTSDSTRVLFEVDHWLSGMDGHMPEIGEVQAQRAVMRLDQFSYPAAMDLLSRYLAGNKRDYLADSIWSTLNSHAEVTLHCHTAVLSKAAENTELAANKTELARSGAAALRAWGLTKKLQRFRYRAPQPALWLAAHELLRTLTRLDSQQMPVVPYHGEAKTTAQDEYLAGLYLECVPLGNLIPQQLEFADRFLRSCAPLELTTLPHQASTYRVDLASSEGPRRLAANAHAEAGMRYCSLVKPRTALIKLAALVKAQRDLPAWLVELPATPEQIEAGIAMLLQHWAKSPPRRTSDRFNQKTELKAMFGFDLARRMIACSHFARTGRSLGYEGVNVDLMFDASRFGRDRTAETLEDSAKPEEIVSAAKDPLEILNSLELTGDKLRMEIWRQVDGSSTGKGVSVPALLARHQIGALVVMRDVNDIEWHMGIIRRIGRDAANLPSVGIDTLPWPSICAQGRPVGSLEAETALRVAGHNWMDAIIVSLEGDELILPVGGFADGLEMDVRSEDGTWRVKLESLLERGPDYERIRFARIS